MATFSNCKAQILFHFFHTAGRASGVKTRLGKPELLYSVVNGGCPDLFILLFCSLP